MSPTSPNATPPFKFMRAVRLSDWRLVHGSAEERSAQYNRLGGQRPEFAD
jgi:hypothetical protein